MRIFLKWKKKEYTPSLLFFFLNMGKSQHAFLFAGVVIVLAVATALFLCILAQTRSKKRSAEACLDVETRTYDHVHLVLYSAEHPHCVEMYKLTRKYYHAFPRIKTIYYTFADLEPSAAGQSVLINDVLHIAGKETYIPGILVKTVKALEYVRAHVRFSGFVIRSNISTIINFDNVLPLLRRRANQIQYAGPAWTVSWVEPEAGLHDDRHHGLKFVSGTCIILSRAVLDRLLDNADGLDYTLIDDLAIGAFMETHLPDVTPLPLANPERADGDVRFTYTEEEWSKKDVRAYVRKEHSRVLFYRNKSEKRKRDVKNMKVILDELIKIKTKKR